jgi:hypothetical protein
MVQDREVLNTKLSVNRILHRLKYVIGYILTRSETRSYLYVDSTWLWCLLCIIASRYQKLVYSLLNLIVLIDTYIEAPYQVIFANASERYVAVLVEDIVERSETVARQKSRPIDSRYSEEERS